MIMLVDIAHSKSDFSTLKEKLASKGKEIGVKISAQHEDILVLSPDIGRILCLLKV